MTNGTSKPCQCRVSGKELCVVDGCLPPSAAATVPTWAGVWTPRAEQRKTRPPTGTHRHGSLLARGLRACRATRREVGRPACWLCARLPCKAGTGRGEGGRLRRGGGPAGPASPVLEDVGDARHACVWADGPLNVCSWGELPSCGIWELWRGQGGGRRLGDESWDVLAQAEGGGRNDEIEGRSEMGWMAGMG